MVPDEQGEQSKQPNVETPARDEQTTLEAACKKPLPSRKKSNRRNTAKLRPYIVAFSWIGSFIVGVITGIGPVLSAYVQADVRNQVYEATHEDKKRALAAQTELLALQEQYLAKLKDIAAAEKRIEEAERQANETSQAAEKLRADHQRDLSRWRLEHERQVQALRVRYAALEAEEKKRAENRAEIDARQKLIEQYRDYTCDVVTLEKPLCDGRLGIQAVFARSTPLEKEVRRDCSSVQASDWQERFRRMVDACSTYRRSVLRAKGLSDADIESVELHDVMNQLNSR